LARIKAHVASREKFGLVILEPSSTDILIGMDFLRTFEAALLLTKLGIALLDEAQFQQLLRNASQTASNEPPTPPTQAPST